MTESRHTMFIHSAIREPARALQNRDNVEKI